ncbi:MAG: ATP-binding cassette domain-containing protein [Senegalimassilia faecalis]
MSLEVDIEKKFKGVHLQSQFTAGDETMGLLGASGCGKSLTMRSIAGIERPDAGKIVVNGTVFFDRAPGKKARVDLTPQQRKTALLFQNYMLFPNLTAAQNVAAGISKDVSPADRDAMVQTELKRFGLSGFEKRYPVQLSGGQQQRVALAHTGGASGHFDA